MIWFKTDAGRAEVQQRALVKERAQRNLLLLIDGVATDEKLLGAVAGVTADDFLALQLLGLIVPDRRTAANRAAASASNRAPVPAPPAAPLDYAQFTTELTQMISRELGLRGFMLTLAVDKAASTQDLLAVAERTLAQIAERKGEAAAAAARRLLYGG